MSDINPEMKAAADYAIRSAKEKFGQELDFSEQSIDKLENLLGQAYRIFSNQAKDEETGNAISRTANIWGSYLGEFMHQKWGGTWILKGSERFVLIKNIEFSPIRFVYQKITSKPDFSMEKYLFEAESKISPSPVIQQEYQKLSDNKIQPKEELYMLTDKDAASATSSNNKSIIRWITPSIIILLILAQVWSLFRIDKLEKSMQQTGSDLSALQVELSQSMSDISALQSWSASASNDISSLFSGLNYVTPLAENANKYAHSHNTYSDMRLKTDITPISGSLESVLAIHGVRFNWSEDAISTLNLSDTPQIGFIAQDVEKHFPEIVTIAPNGYRMVNYDELIPVLFEAIQEQQTIIDSLQLKISIIENHH